MYEGFLKIGSEEVLNASRTAAYAAGGCVPPDTLVDVPVACEGLAAALGDDEYRLPAIDGAPWFEPENPDTHWFGGLIPLDVTGLEGSTFGTTTSESIGDGGVATLARRAVRTITVSALLIGRDAASVHAGLEWLTTVLTRTCSGDSACDGTTLEVFTTCPAPVGFTENLDAALEDHLIAAGGEWFTRDGSWDHAGVFTVTDTSLVLDGGGADTDYTGLDTYDGGGADTDYTTLDTLDGGGHRDGFGVLAPPDLFDCTLSEVDAVWTITPTGGDPVSVRFGQVDAQGRVLDQNPDYTTVPSGGATVITRTYLSRFEDWRPAIWVEAPGATVTLNVRHRPYLTVEECVGPFRRTYTNVVLAAAPKVVASFSVSEDSDARLVQVEWTWTSDPYRYTVPVTLIAGMSTAVGVTPTVLHGGCLYTRIGSVTAADTACVEPTDPPGICAWDPDYPRLVRPPTVPTIVDPDFPDPASYRRALLDVSPSIVPLAGVGAGVITITNDNNDVRGVRVRVWAADTTDTFADMDECDWVQEFTVMYLPANGVLLIDTTTQTVSVVCANGRVFDGKHLMRGPYGGAFMYPTMSCDRRHFLTVDHPVSAGAVTVAVSLAVREG